MGRGGGYHEVRQRRQNLPRPRSSDYALVWSKGGKQRVLQICYGCHEWKYFGPGGMIHTDIEDKTFFHKLLPLLPRKK